MRRVSSSIAFSLDPYRSQEGWLVLGGVSGPEKRDCLPKRACPKEIDCAPTFPGRAWSNEVLYAESLVVAKTWPALCVCLSIHPTMHPSQTRLPPFHSRLLSLVLTANPTDWDQHLDEVFFLQNRPSDYVRDLWRFWLAPLGCVDGHIL